jgi:hypothetical protein
MPVSQMANGSKAGMCYWHMLHRMLASHQCQHKVGPHGVAAVLHLIQQTSMCNCQGCVLRRNPTIAGRPCSSKGQHKSNVHKNSKQHIAWPDVSLSWPLHYKRGRSTKAGLKQQPAINSCRLSTANRQYYCRRPTALPDSGTSTANILSWQLNCAS